MYKASLSSSSSSSSSSLSRCEFSSSSLPSPSLDHFRFSIGSSCLTVLVKADKAAALANASSPRRLPSWNSPMVPRYSFCAVCLAHAVNGFDKDNSRSSFYIGFLYTSAVCNCRTGIQEFDIGVIPGVILGIISLG